MNNLTLQLKQLEKEELENPRVSRRKEILKIRAEINAKVIFKYQLCICYLKNGSKPGHT